MAEGWLKVQGIWLLLDLAWLVMKAEDERVALPLSIGWLMTFRLVSDKPLKGHFRSFDRHFRHMLGITNLISFIIESMTGSSGRSEEIDLSFMA